MSFEYFIARRFISKKTQGKTSSPVVKIGIWAIAFGLSMMQISVSTGTGLQKEIRNKLVAFNGHIQLLSYDGNESQVLTNPIFASDSLKKNLYDIEGVTKVIEVASEVVLLRTDDSFEGIMVKGVGKHYPWNQVEPYLIKGEFPPTDAEVSTDILISNHLAKRLKININDRLQALFLKADKKIPNQRFFKICGIYESGFQEFDANYAFIDIRHIQHINKWKPHQVGALEVFVDDMEDIQDVNRYIYKNTPSDVNTSTIIDKYGAVIDWINIMDYNIYIIIAIMIIVSGVNMITVMLVLILERTSIIGILKALGADNWNIRKIFLYQSAYLISRGLLIGNIIGLGLLSIQKYTGFIGLDPKIYYVNSVPVSIGIYQILILNVGTLLCCLLMMILPSHIISKITPIKAINFK